MLYASLLAPEFRHSSKNNLYLNLLYRVMKSCENRRIVMALLKRVLQCAMMMPANVACGLLYMVSTVLSERRELKINDQLKKLMDEHAFNLGSEEEKKEEEEGENEKKEEGEKKEEMEEENKGEEKEEEGMEEDSEEEEEEEEEDSEEEDEDNEEDSEEEDSEEESEEEESESEKEDEDSEEKKEEDKEEEENNTKMEVEEDSEEGEDEVADLDEAFFEESDKESEKENEKESEKEKEKEKEEPSKSEPKKPSKKESDKEKPAKQGKEKEKESDDSSPAPATSSTPLRPLVYDMNARDPNFSNSDQTFLFELTLLAHHYHPTVAHFANQLLEGSRVFCSGDPLIDFSNKAFLDKFAYKHPKQKDLDNARDRGSSVMQSHTKAKSLTQPPVNSEAFLKQKEEDVAIEDQFFYKFFKERAKREGTKKPKKNASEMSSDEDLDDFANKLATDLIKENMGDEADDFINEFEDDQNGRFLEEGSNDELC